MVTTVLLPAVRRFKDDDDPVAFFEEVEGRFAWQARLTTLLTGLSGFWMIHLSDGWGRFTQPAFWYYGAMTFVWLVFTLMLFVLEPLVLHRWFLKRGKEDPKGTLRLIHRLHWFLLTLSLVTVAGAVAGSHGWFFF